MFHKYSFNILHWGLFEQPIEKMYKHIPDIVIILRA